MDPNSFIQLFPERFVGIEPHPRWFEPDLEAIAQDLRAVIESIPPLDILAVLPPPVPGASFQPRGGNLSFYRPQSEWLDHFGVTVLPFADYDAVLREIVDRFDVDIGPMVIPQINSAAGSLNELIYENLIAIKEYYKNDMPL